MSGFAAAAFLAIQSLQLLLVDLESYLAIGTNFYPATSSVTLINSIQSFDYIIVGGGQAGAIVASRLSECTNMTVLLIEEGGCAPMESLKPRYFPYIPNSKYDFAMNFSNDNYSCQNQKPDGGATIGRMLGGSSALDHMLHVTPSKTDYDGWVEFINDLSWNYDSMMKYVTKSENVKNEDVLAQNTSLHGTDGPVIMTKQSCRSLKNVIAAHEEIEIPYKSDADGICCINPLLTIGDGKRQSANVAYLSKTVTRKNLYVLTNALVTKVNFNGTMATGVQYEVNGTYYTAYANKTVIVSAGAIRSPQLLMLSGIGNADNLKKLDVDVVVDNPYVGQNLYDHLGVVFAVSLNKNLATASPTDPSMFPVELLISRVGLNTSSNVPDIQAVILYFPLNSSSILDFCTNAFKYDNKVCDTIYSKNTHTDTLIFAVNLMDVASNGSINVKSQNIKDQPEIKLGLMSNKSDLEKFAQVMFNYVEPLLNTTSFQNLEPEIVDLGFCKDHVALSLEFWECYIVEMSTTYWHYISTCALGKVLDPSLNVKGTTNMKVIDASAIPKQISGKLGSYVRALAEKGADTVKLENGCCST